MSLKDLKIILISQLWLWGSPNFKQECPIQMHDWVLTLPFPAVCGYCVISGASCPSLQPTSNCSSSWDGWFCTSSDMSSQWHLCPQWPIQGRSRPRDLGERGILAYMPQLPFVQVTILPTTFCLPENSRVSHKLIWYIHPILFIPQKKKKKHFNVLWLSRGKRSKYLYSVGNDWWDICLKFFVLLRVESLKYKLLK